MEQHGEAPLAIKRGMNILMLGWELPPHNSGGLGVACYHLAKALALQGTSIDFVVPYSATHENIDFMTVHNATKLSPLERYGLGAYDSQFLLDRKDGADIAGLKDIRDVQRQYTRFIERHIETEQPS